MADTPDGAAKKVKQFSIVEADWTIEPRNGNKPKSSDIPYCKYLYYKFFYNFLNISQF